jgi:hypothetical protein
MPKIGPALTEDELAASAEATFDGKPLKKRVTRRAPTGRPALPGVIADAFLVDARAYNTNGDLAEAIRAAVGKLKESDKGVPRFVLGWRMYPNAASSHWKKAGSLVHSCGCGCGCCSSDKKKRRKKGG